MKKYKAIEEASDYTLKTGDTAYVVCINGDFDWFCRSYFDNGISESMRVVYSTEKK